MPIIDNGKKIWILQEGTFTFQFALKGTRLNFITKLLHMSDPIKICRLDLLRTHCVIPYNFAKLLLCSSCFVVNIPFCSKYAFIEWWQIKNIQSFDDGK